MGHGNREVLVPRSEELSEMWQRGGGGEAEGRHGALGLHFLAGGVKKLTGKVEVN